MSELCPDAICNILYMKVLISGSTGLVGTQLMSALRQRNHEVTTIGRTDFEKDIKFLAEKVSHADIVIHLAGAPIVARWTESYKKTIVASRILTTRMISQAIEMAESKPGLFISTSAVGIYPGDKIYTESNTAHGTDFLSQVCIDWEAEALKSKAFTKVAIFRLGVVLSRDGGALPKMLLPFKTGLGGRIASGRQGFSWIHIQDLINAYLFVIEQNIDGIFNLTSPEVTNNAGFTKALAKTLHRPALLPVPAFALRLIYGEGAVTLTSGQKAIPERLQKAGFMFQFPEIHEALRHLTKSKQHI